jgi:hypothetical protein
MCRRILVTPSTLIIAICLSDKSSPAGICNATKATVPTMFPMFDEVNDFSIRTHALPGVGELRTPPRSTRTSLDNESTQSFLNQAISRKARSREPPSQSSVKSQSATPPTSPPRFDAITTKIKPVVAGHDNEIAIDGVTNKQFAELITLADAGRDGF